MPRQRNYQHLDHGKDEPCLICEAEREKKLPGIFRNEILVRISDDYITTRPADVEPGKLYFTRRIPK